MNLVESVYSVAAESVAVAVRVITCGSDIVPEDEKMISSCVPGLAVSRSPQMPPG